MTQERHAARETRARLARTFPRCFAPPHRPGQTPPKKTPLKLNIHLDLQGALPRIPVHDLMAGIRCYVSTPSYLQECVEGATRIDLDGHRAGVVSAQEAAYARAALVELEARIAAKAIRRTAKPPTRRNRAQPRRQAAE